MTRATHFGLHPWQGWKRKMSDAIQPGYYWASPEGSDDREIVRVAADQVGKPCVYAIGRDDDRPLAWYTNYVPVPSEMTITDAADRQFVFDGNPTACINGEHIKVTPGNRLTAVPSEAGWDVRIEADSPD